MRCRQQKHSFSTSQNVSESYWHLLLYRWESCWLRIHQVGICSVRPWPRCVEWLLHLAATLVHSLYSPTVAYWKFQKCLLVLFSLASVLASAPILRFSAGHLPDVSLGIQGALLHTTAAAMSSGTTARNTTEVSTEVSHSLCAPLCDFPATWIVTGVDALITMLFMLGLWVLRAAEVAEGDMSRQEL